MTLTMALASVLLEARVIGAGVIAERAHKRSHVVHVHCESRRGEGLLCGEGWGL